MSVAYERICEYPSPLRSPVEVDGALYIVAQNGEIFKFKEGQLKTDFHHQGQPSSIAVDKENKDIYLADVANQAIYKRSFDEKIPNEILVKEYEGTALLGPNSIVLSQTQNTLFFTDSGPFGDTSIEKCIGSVYMIDLENSNIRPLALNCLAYPSGLVLSNDEKILYVCETCKNRLLRFVLTDLGVFYFSVYYQFSGRFGPTAVAVSRSDLLYVARYEFQQISEEGVISVLNHKGAIINNITIPGCPEISGMTFSSFKNNILYVTENSAPSCLRILVQPEDSEENPRKEGHNNSFRQQLLK